MDIRPPVILNPDRYSVNLGDGEQKCGVLVPAIVGAIAFYVIPPFLSGFFNTVRDEWRNR